MVAVFLQVKEETDAEASGITGYLVALERRGMGAKEGDELPGGMLGVAVAPGGLSTGSRSRW
jgi:hypothetical protein